MLGQARGPGTATKRSTFNVHFIMKCGGSKVTQEDLIISKINLESVLNNVFGPPLPLLSILYRVLGGVLGAYCRKEGILQGTMGTGATWGC